MARRPVRPRSDATVRYAAKQRNLTGRGLVPTELLGVGTGRGAIGHIGEQSMRCRSDSLRGVFSDASEELVTQLPKMPVGTCVLTGAAETIKHATMINVRSRETTHGGKTPEIWSEYEKAGWKGKKSLPYIRNKE